MAKAKRNVKLARRIAQAWDRAKKYYAKVTRCQ